MTKLLLIALGGGAGSVLRYLISTVTHQIYGSLFPAGTLAVNILGSLVIGLLWGLSENFTFSRDIKVFVFVGILGGFTTFSTYALETFNLLQDRQFALAAANFIATNVLCLLACFLGFLAGSILIERIK